MQSTAGLSCAVGPCCCTAALQSRVLTPHPVCQCGGDARGRPDAWSGATGSESVLGAGESVLGAAVGRAGDGRELPHGRVGTQQWVLG